MGKHGFRFLLYIGLSIGSIGSYAQENDLEVADSTEVYLEDYSDEFQEAFFEALKQKGIENYDRTINLLLECKRLQADNGVVDYELAKAYQASKQLPLAQDYAIAALRSMPENYWVLSTLLVIMEQQGRNLDVIKPYIPVNNIKLQENLALIYYRQQNYESALKTLNDMEGSVFSRELTLKINDSLKDKEMEQQKELKPIEEPRISNPITDYISLISGLLEESSFKEVEIQSKQAIESFPTHPYFYYAYGVALNNKGQNKEAIMILETGLDFLLDDVGLANKIYQQLANANKALGNSSKSNMYLSKIKPGL